MKVLSDGKLKCHKPQISPENTCSFRDGSSLIDFKRCTGHHTFILITISYYESNEGKNEDSDFRTLKYGVVCLKINKSKETEFVSSKKPPLPHSNNLRLELHNKVNLSDYVDF